MYFVLQNTHTHTLMRRKTKGHEDVRKDYVVPARRRQGRGEILEHFLSQEQQKCGSGAD